MKSREECRVDTRSDRAQGDGEGKEGGEGTMNLGDNAEKSSSHTRGS